MILGFSLENLFSDFPSRGPEIVVGRSEYQAGEQVGASCTVPASNPYSTLAWYINDEPVSNNKKILYTSLGH